MVHRPLDEVSVRQNLLKLLEADPPNEERLLAEFERHLLDYFVNVNQELRNPKVIEIAIYERTARSAVTDGLTGLFNHAYLSRPSSGRCCAPGATT